MERILVTTDFSGNSRAGIRFALQLAAQREAELIFYHIIEVMQPTSWSDKKFHAFSEAKNREFRNKLESFVEGIARKDGFSKGNYKYVTQIGAVDIPGMIIKCAKHYKAGYICMSTRGAGAFAKLFGTVASGMITYSTIPLLIIPHGYRLKPINCVFYASDFASLGTELKTVLKFSTPLNAKVKVYHYDYLLHVDVNKRKLEKLAEKNASPGVTFTFRRQEIERSLSEHLENDIKKEKASIVVLFTKQNRNWFDKLFARMEARDMAFNAEIPLLIFRKK
jgi:nucleotide-binding universal stress UspA family protein